MALKYGNLSKTGTRKFHIQLLRDSRRCCFIALPRNALAAFNITFPAQMKSTVLPVLVDGPVEINPFTPHFDVCLVAPPGAADRPGVSVPALLELRRVMLHQRKIVVCASSTPLSAIMATRSR